MTTKRKGVLNNPQVGLLLSGLRAHGAAVLTGLAHHTEDLIPIYPAGRGGGAESRGSPPPEEVRTEQPPPRVKGQ